jgi:hypothetical protein
MDATITTRRGCEDVSLPLSVRHVRPVGADRWRVGAEFVEATAPSLNALVELCVVEPARRRLAHAGGVDVPLPIPEVVEPVMDGRRLPLRLIALLAVLGAIASAQPGDGTAVAWIVSSLSILVAAGVLAGSARPRHAGPSTGGAADQSTSSASPDLAIR